MSDKRLIDANALLNKADYYRCRECGDEDYIQVVTENDIYAAPTIDAVEVVRCKDCREADYYSTHDPDGMYCGVWDTVVRCNGYCDHGAKMDGGAEG